MLTLLFKQHNWVPGGSDGEAGVLGLIPGKIPGEGNGNPLQYSCLRNPMDRGVWRGHKGSDMTEQLSTHWLRLKINSSPGMLWIKDWVLTVH